MRSFNDQVTPRSGTGPTLRAIEYPPIRGDARTNIAHLFKPLLTKLSRTVLMVRRAVQALRPTFRASRADQSAGFTLIEVAAVMLIVAIVASLAIATMRGTGRAKLRAVSLDAAALLRRERLSAIMTRNDREVLLEDRKLIGLGGTAVAIPDDVVLLILGVERPLRHRQAIVRFHPDGSSSGAVLKFSREESHYEVRVNWFTGGVAISEAGSVQ